MKHILLLALVVLFGGCASSAKKTGPLLDMEASPNMWRLTFDKRLEQNDFAAPILNVDFSNDTLPFLINTSSPTHTMDTWAAASVKLSEKSPDVIKTALRIDGETLEPANIYVSKMNSRYEQNGVAGSLSPQLLLKSKAIALDFLNSKLYRGEFADLAKQHMANPVTTETGSVCRDQGPEKASLYILRVKVNGESINMLVDSSAEDTTLATSHPLAEKLRKHGKASYSKLYKATVMIDGKTISRHLDIKNFSELPCKAEGLLGMDVLKLCNIVISNTELAINCRNN